MKNIIKSIIFFIIILVVALGSAYVGMNYQEKKIIQIEQKEEKIETIAIVNLDDGIVQDDRVINYGISLANTSTEEIVNVGLEEARRGIQEGRYAAYVIIPATFSESVVSLNTTPEKAVIQYEINEKLSEEIREKTIYRIFNYERELNNELGYLYIFAILQEFHAAQDNAATVLENDITDLEVLQSINQMDMVVAIPIGEVEYAENTITGLELSENYNMNSQMLGSMNEKYNEYIQMSLPELQTIAENSETIADDVILMQLIANMGSFANIVDEDTKVYVYDEGNNNLATLLTAYNEEVENTKTTVQEQIDGYVTQVQTNNSEIGAGVSELMAQMDVYDLYITDGEIAVTDYVEQMIITSDARLQEILGKDLNLGDAGYAESVKGQYNNIKTSFRNFASEQLSSEIETQIITSGSPKVREPILALMEEQLITNNIEYLPNLNLDEFNAMAQELELNEAIIASLGTTGTIADLITDTNADSLHPLNVLVSDLGIVGIYTFDDYQNWKSWGGSRNYTSTDIVNSYQMNVTGYIKNCLELDIENIEQNIFATKIQDEVQRIFMEEKAANIDTINENIYTAEIPELGMGITYETMSLNLQNYSLDLTNEIVWEDKPEVSEELLMQLNNRLTEELELGVNIDEFVMVDGEGITNLVAEEIIMPMTQKTAAENIELTEAYGQRMSLIEGLKQQISRYNPLSHMNYGEIGTMELDLRENIMKIQERVFEHSTQYTDYVSNIRQTAQSNVDMFRENIFAANESAKTLLEEGLGEAKESRTTSSQVNQTLLKQFISKLPYTRLGQGPYAKAYEFIIEPTLLHTSSIARGNTRPEDSWQVVVEEKFNMNQIINIGLGIVALLLVLIVIKECMEQVKKGKGEIIE